MPTLQKVELAGPPRAMGRAYGEQFRQGIRELTESRIAHVAERLASHAPGADLTREEILRLSAGTADAHRRYDPGVWQEFRGIAEGAGVAVEELLIGNGYTDFRDYALRRFGAGSKDAEPPGECSAFLIPAARADGPPVVGQTWDMNTDAARHVVLVRRRPDDAPETLGVTTAGCLCLIGMNAEGVAIGNTNVTPTDARAGVNYLFTITRALACRSAEQAARTVEATPRMSGHNFYMADARTAINVEATAAEARRTVVADDVLVHTNHYVDPRLRGYELPHDLANSQWRHRRLAESFAKLTGRLTMDDGWAQLADNTRGDGAVCNEDAEGVYGPVSTLATVVQCPGQRRMYVCLGGARLGQKEELTL